MITNEQLQSFLKGYSSDAEVIIMGTDKGEVKHVGMCHTNEGKYRVVLASEKPKFCCDVCGGNVYKSNSPLGYYCPCCGKYRDLGRITRL